MKIGIIGLGLIGGSMAKAISEHTDHTVLGLDLDPCIVLKAKMTKVISLLPFIRRPRWNTSPSTPIR